MIHGVTDGMEEHTLFNDANGTVVASGGMTSGSSFSDTLCLVDGCYDVTVGGGSYDSEITFDFGSLSGVNSLEHIQLFRLVQFNIWLYRLS